MDIHFLLNPWVISFLVVAFVIGNLATLKYLGKHTPVRRSSSKESDLQKLIKIYQEKDAKAANDEQKDNKPSSSDKE